MSASVCLPITPVIWGTVYIALVCIILSTSLIAPLIPASTIYIFTSPIGPVSTVLSIPWSIS